MASQFKNLDLNDEFTLYKKGILTDLDNQVLISLYQPLIGPVAFTILMMLWQTVGENSKPVSHINLISDLNLNINVFYENRIKLEAVELQHTYQIKNSGSLNVRKLIYELVPPLSAYDFFKDDILSLALYEAVGKRRFQQLENKFIYPEFIINDNVIDISKSFYDVFYAPIRPVPSIVNDARNRVNQRQKKRKKEFSQEEMQSFNWQYFKSVVARNHISSAEVDSHQLQLFNLATFYNIDETKLANLTNMTMNISTNTIDMAALQNVVLKTYQRVQNKNLSMSNNSVSSLINDNDIVSNDLLKEVGFNDDEIMFIQTDLLLYPREFLEKYRQLHNNFTSKIDLLSLNVLMNRHVLNNSVINILVAYILMNHNNLTQSVVDTIANEWYQQKIDSPDKALMQIIKYQKNIQSKTYHVKSNYKRLSRKEEIPKWMRSDYKSPTMSKEEIKSLKKKSQELLEKLNSKKDDSYATNKKQYE